MTDQDFNDKLKSLSVKLVRFLGDQKDIDPELARCALGTAMSTLFETQMQVSKSQTEKREICETVMASAHSLLRQLDDLVKKYEVEGIQFSIEEIADPAQLDQ